MGFRLLMTGFRSAFENMAIDEAILMQNSEKKSPPTLRFYGWSPAAVSIGYFQGMSQEVDVDECRKKGVDVIRRITGGGAVFHEHELTYSFICPEDGSFISKNILESYRQICSGIIKGMELLSLKAEFVPLNDIVINGRKVSGNAQTRRRGCILQHGTILLNVNPDKMFSLLKVPSEKIKDKMIQAVKQRVTSISLELKRDVDFEFVRKKMESGFSQALNIVFTEQDLTKEEQAISEMIRKEKYGADEWNFRR